MLEWTATTRANATPEQVLEALTHPDEIRRWSPVEFDLEELDGRRLAAGTRGRVTGKLAGVRVGFDVEVHAADEARLELSADGPVGLDVRYELTVDEAGAELSARVSMRRRRRPHRAPGGERRRGDALRGRARRRGRADRPRSPSRSSQPRRRLGARRLSETRHAYSRDPAASTGLLPGEKRDARRVTLPSRSTAWMANSWSSSTWLGAALHLHAPEREHRVAEVADLGLLEAKLLRGLPIPRQTETPPPREPR